MYDYLLNIDNGRQYIAKFNSKKELCKEINSRCLASGSRFKLNHINNLGMDIYRRIKDNQFELLQGEKLEELIDSYIISRTKKDIRQAIKRNINNENKVNEIMNFLKIYEKGDFLYKQAFIQEFNLSKKEVKNIFKAFNNYPLIDGTNLITTYYKPYCYNCNEGFGNKHETKKDCKTQIEDVLEICENENCNTSLKVNKLYQINKSL